MLVPRPRAQGALEPTIDAATMKFHHDFHHQAYINNLNKAMAGKDKASLVSLMPGAKAAKLNNAGGGHYNHCMFWTIMGPKCGGEPSGEPPASLHHGTAAAPHSAAPSSNLCTSATPRVVLRRSVPRCAPHANVPPLVAPTCPRAQVCSETRLRTPTAPLTTSRLRSAPRRRASSAQAGLGSRWPRTARSRS